jgi:hypothetical protein
MILEGTGARTCLGVVERNLRDEDAADTLGRTAEGRVARCILPFIPLMRGGADAGIIEQWKEIAQADPDARKRADYAGLALVFAELTDCQPIWKRALEGWNVEQSMQVLEWQAQAERRGVARGRAESLLDVLHERLRSRVPPDVEVAIRTTTDVHQLARWLHAALVASSLTEFRRLAGLEAKRNGQRKRKKTNGS